MAPGDCRIETVYVFRVEVGLGKDEVDEVIFQASITRQSSVVISLPAENSSACVVIPYPFLSGSCLTIGKCCVVWRPAAIRDFVVIPYFTPGGEMRVEKPKVDVGVWNNYLQETKKVVRGGPKRWEILCATPRRKDRPRVQTVSEKANEGRKLHRKPSTSTDERLAKE